MTWQQSLRGGVIAALVPLVLASCAAVPLDEAQAVLREADRAMGGVALKSLRYTASGSGASFGQAWQPGMAWPRVNIPALARVLDYENGAWREDTTRSRAEPTGGGAIALAGERRDTGFLRGDFAWNQAGANPVAAPAAWAARTHDLWTSPHGILKAGMRNAASLRVEGTRRIVSFTEPGRFNASVWINAQGEVERVDSVLPNAVMGDTASVTLYSGYREFGGIRFPTRIQQHQGGFPVLDLTVKEVEPNAAARIEVPATVASFAERVAVEKVADGVWFLAGGSHNSVLIEMQDHAILVESPLYDGRALAVMAQAKLLLPAKPVRWAINSHHHFDHSGGLRAAAAQGATLVVSEQARPWFERVMARPNTVRPDALARSGLKAAVSGVNGQRRFSDATRIVDVLMIEDSLHAQGFMMIWLPLDRLLIQADAYTPGAPGAAAPTVPDANHLNLVHNIERLRLDVDRIVPLHGRIVPMGELRRVTGRAP